MSGDLPHHVLQYCVLDDRAASRGQPVPPLHGPVHLYGPGSPVSWSAGGGRIHLTAGTTGWGVRAFFQWGEDNRYIPSPPRLPPSLDPSLPSQSCSSLDSLSTLTRSPNICSGARMSLMSGVYQIFTPAQNWQNSLGIFLCVSEGMALRG